MSRSLDFRPIGKAEQVAIAEKMIDDIKAICPRFSIPHDSDARLRLIHIWARAIFFDREYPRSIYDEAIGAYAATASRDDNPPMPGDILRNCRIAMERASTDPIKRGIIEEWRESRRAYRDATLGSG